MRQPLWRGRTWIFVGALVAVIIVSLLVRSARPSQVAATGPSEQIRSLPYATWAPAEEGDERRGVTVHDVERAWQGANLYSSRESHRAFLLDMEGQVLHRWDAQIEPGDTWQLVEPLGNGELLVIVSNRRLMKIDRDSRVVWQVDGRFHHDVAVTSEGELFVLSRQELDVERAGTTLPVLDDVMVHLSSSGEVLDQVSIFELFEDRILERQWRGLEAWMETDTAIAKMKRHFQNRGFRLDEGSPHDLLHTNSVEILGNGVEGVAGAGALLISIRELSTIAIVDFAHRRIDWAWGPKAIDEQHHPSLLASGRILVYDNLGGEQGATRVLEVDPHTLEVVWEFNGDPPRSFFSAFRGGAQRLPNGNTLITESDRGRVFEITTAGEIVWEFFNPVTRTGGNERATIYRMMRLAPETLYWLESGR